MAGRERSLAGTGVATGSYLRGVGSSAGTGAICATECERLGWRRSWINTTTLMTRYNESALLVLGKIEPGMGNFSPREQMQGGDHRKRSFQIGAADAEVLLPGNQRTSREMVIEALEKRFLQGQLQPKHREALLEFLGAKTKWDDTIILNAIRLIMSTPEYQIA